MKTEPPLKARKKRSTIQSAASSGDLQIRIPADSTSAGAFDGSTRIPVAVNQEMCEPSAAIGPVDEIAFFPPFTGG